MYRLIARTSGIAGFLLCFLSVYSGNNASKPIEDYILYESVSSLQYRDSLVCSVTFAIPLIVEHLLDNTMKNRLGNLFRLFRVVGLLVPNFIILISIEKSPSMIVPYIPSIISAQFIIYIYGFFGLIHDLDPSFWTKKLCVFFVYLFVPLIVLNSFRGTFSNHSIPLTIAVGIIFYPTIFIFLLKCYTWAKKIHHSIKYDGKSLSHDQYCCAIQLVGMILYILIGRGLLTIVYGYVDWYNITANELINWVYVDVVSLFLVHIFSDRLSKRQLVLAQHALEIKRNFVNYISHEMRTPLNTIFLGLNLLKDDYIKDEGETERLEVVNDLLESCEVTLLTLNELLAFDKLESGMLKLELTTIKVWEFLVKTVKPFSVQAQQVGVTLKFSDEETLASELFGVTLEGDENKLAQVVRNFVSNALKFTPRGGSVTIKVEVVLRVDDTGSSISLANSLGSASTAERFINSEMLRIEVIDTGAGISMENQKKVFKEVVQFNPGKLQGGGGSGLGLYITRGIVELHNGNVSVFSAGEGLGSKFTVEIPLSQNPPEWASLAKPASAKTPKYGRVSGFLNDIVSFGSGNNRDRDRDRERREAPNALGSCAAAEELRQPVVSSRIARVPSLSFRTRNPVLLSSRLRQSLYQAGSMRMQSASEVPDSARSDSTQPASRFRVLEYSESMEVAPFRVREVPPPAELPESSSRSSGRGLVHVTAEPPTPVTTPPPTALTKAMSLRRFMPLAGSEGLKQPRRTGVGNRLRVLVVDDSILSRKMLCRHLRKRCEVIYEADNGEQALEILKESADRGLPMDVVMMDHQMPEMDGPTAAKTMRSLGFRGMVVGITGNVLQTEMLTYKSSGADYVLTKPLDMDKLYKCLADFDVPRKTSDKYFSLVQSILSRSSSEDSPALVSSTPHALPSPSHRGPWLVTDV